MLGFHRPGKRPANALLLRDLGLSSDDQPKLRGTAPGSRPQLGALLPGSGRECLSLVREHLGVGESAVVVGVPPLSWTPSRWPGIVRPGGNDRCPCPGDRSTTSPTRPSPGCGSHERSRFGGELFPVAAVVIQGGTFTTSSRAAEGQQTLEIEPRQSCAISRQSPQSRINRAIARQSSPIVVSPEQACHAGGRGFESRRSR
jgi:hypothetical protein